MQREEEDIHVSASMPSSQQKVFAQTWADTAMLNEETKDCRA